MDEIRQLVVEPVVDTFGLETRIEKISAYFRHVQAPRVSVELSPGVKLAWNGIRGNWRFIVQFDDEVEELRHCSKAIQMEAFTSGAMTRLFEKVFGIGEAVDAGKKPRKTGGRRKLAA